MITKHKAAIIANRIRREIESIQSVTGYWFGFADGVLRATGHESLPECDMAGAEAITENLRRIAEELEGA